MILVIVMIGCLACASMANPKIPLTIFIISVALYILYRVSKPILVTVPVDYAIFTLLGLTLGAGITMLFFRRE
jgi:hypothetical protein